MKFGVVTFPGATCDTDMVYVLQDLMELETVALWHKEEDLKGAEFIILPGGFSYGDYLRSGAIAKLSPIMKAVMKHAERGGYVMGICNGFQILTEARMLEGSLSHNIGQKFVCKNVELKPISQNSIITKGIDFSRTYTVPIAHGKGRFYAPEDKIKELHDNDQILFKYASKEGVVDLSSNPNGAVENIAGIQNKKGNVLGIMPHLERATSDILGNIDGFILFENILKNIK